MVISVIISGLIFGIDCLLQNKNYDNGNPEYSNCELGDLVGEDVERIYSFF